MNSTEINKAYKNKYKCSYKYKREQAIAYQKEYNKKNKEKIKIRTKKYCEENKEKIKKYNHDYFQKNKKRIIEKRKILIKYRKEKKE